MNLLTGGTPCQADDDRLVTVCEACLRAACWQAKFFCQEYVTANSRRLPIRELRKLGREHPRFWTIACEQGEA
jgi:hypothetical protein